MKKVLLLIGISFLAACGSGGKKYTSSEDSLTSANTGIQNELKTKDSLINNKEEAMTEFISSFNEIQENLNEIKKKEKIISTNYNNKELKKSNKDQIIGDIQAIYDLLGKNKQKVARLNKKLKDSNLKISELETAVENLTNQLTENAEEITDLKSKLETLNVDFKNLKMEYNQEKQDSDLKTEKLNTGYYVVGTTKDLTKKGIITKEGGFIGIGKVAELSKTLDKNYFTKIDITKTKEIPISAKKVNLVTTPPDGSYKMIEGATSIIKLIILDEEKFWSVSKYLIIAADKQEK